MKSAHTSTAVSLLDCVFLKERTLEPCRVGAGSNRAKIGTIPVKPFILTAYFCCSRQCLSKYVAGRAKHKICFAVTFHLHVSSLKLIIRSQNERFHGHCSSRCVANHAVRSQGSLGGTCTTPSPARTKHGRLGCAPTPTPGMVLAILSSLQHLRTGGTRTHRAVSTGGWALL